MLVQTPCPSASLFLLFHVNHTTIFISRPGERVVALISCVCINAVLAAFLRALGEMSISSCPRHGFIRAIIFTMFSHHFVIHSSSKRGIKICQALEGVLCSAMRVIMPVPQPIHTDRKANPSRGNEWMDNHLLKRKMLRQLGAMAIRILSLISAVSLCSV